MIDSRRSDPLNILLPSFDKIQRLQQIVLFYKSIKVTTHCSRDRNYRLAIAREGAARVFGERTDPVELIPIQLGIALTHVAAVSSAQAAA